MEGDGFSAKQVVASRGVGRDLDVHLTTVGVEVLGAPVVVGAAGAPRGPGVLEDLVPTRGAVGGSGIVYFSQVGEYRTVVSAADGLVGAGAVAGLLVHLDGHGGAGDDDALVAGGSVVGIACPLPFRQYDEVKVMNQAVQGRSLHRILLLVTSVMGELLNGVLTQVAPCRHKNVRRGCLKIFLRSYGYTYHINPVDPELLERGMCSHFLDSNSRQAGENSGRLHIAIKSFSYSKATNCQATSENEKFGQIQGVKKALLGCTALLWSGVKRK